MRKLLSLLVMLVFVVTNSSAVAAATCQHADAAEHVAALQSSDSREAAPAHAEEAAAAAAKTKASLVKGAAVHLSGFLLPADVTIAQVGRSEPARSPPAEPKQLLSRDISPLLEPPLS